MSDNYVNFCTLTLICEKTRVPLIFLNVEIKTGDAEIWENGFLGRRIRLSLEGRPGAGFEYATAYTRDGADRNALGIVTPLQLRYTLGTGPLTSHWMKQSIQLDIKKRWAATANILACAPITGDDTSDPSIERREPRQSERPFYRDAFRFGASKKSQSEIEWLEIQTVLNRQSYATAQDVSRVRKAMALLLHSDTRKTDTLARVNAYLDEREQALQPLAKAVS